ncbi:MAG: S24 family peptidase [Patescibacteria group bacterium]|nr:S24 family peptidase [Patescibacteria group bacterium]MDD5121718.1 S24 family peptidase [Patescibacteria group bacterium]MDD5221713.1 S24 family peptidase [Patescibacteria group bacterium]MDD5396118.1 S24 family peptidase [Patescibacteria group bacterium]
MTIHKTQLKLLELMKTHNLNGLSLRDIGELIGIKDKPHIIRHHLLQLKKRGLIYWDQSKKEIRKISKGIESDSGLVPIPILGAANCGPATLLAEQNIQGYLRISKRFLPRVTKNIFAIRAVGSSLNRADVDHKGMHIDDGDYVLIDSSYRNPQNKDYVLSVIDDVANIKKFIREKNKITLLSESTENIPPIYIHRDDNYMINGKVIQVIKKPKID